jgi:hypothetical protein
MKCIKEKKEKENKKENLIKLICNVAKILESNYICFENNYCFFEIDDKEKNKIQVKIYLENANFKNSFAVDYKELKTLQNISEITEIKDNEKYMIIKTKENEIEISKRLHDIKMSNTYDNIEYKNEVFFNNSIIYHLKVLDSVLDTDDDGFNKVCFDFKNSRLVATNGKSLTAFNVLTQKDLAFCLQREIIKILIHLDTSFTLTYTDDYFNIKAKNIEIKGKFLRAIDYLFVFDFLNRDYFYSFKYNTKELINYINLFSRSREDNWYWKDFGFCIRDNILYLENIKYDSIDNKVEVLNKIKLMELKEKVDDYSIYLNQKLFLDVIKKLKDKEILISLPKNDYVIIIEFENGINFLCALKYKEKEKNKEDNL